MYINKNASRYLIKYEVSIRANFIKVFPLEDFIKIIPLLSSNIYKKMWILWNWYKSKKVEVYNIRL